MIDEAGGSADKKLKRLQHREIVLFRMICFFVRMYGGVSLVRCRRYII